MPGLKRIALALVAGLVLAGCASIQKTASSEQFDLRSWAFLRAIRWGDIEKLPVFFAPDVDFPQRAALEEVRVTDVDAGPWQVTSDAMHITQSVTFKYYRTDTLVEKSLTADQVWRYDPDAHNWFLESGFPAFSPPK